MNGQMVAREIMAVAKILAGAGVRTAHMSFAEIIAEFPVKNDAWHADEKNEVMSGFVSDFRSVHRDPWNRPMPTNMQPERDNEGEITAWNGAVMVHGIRVRLVVFND